jgi:hypothetical protein
MLNLTIVIKVTWTNNFEYRSGKGIHLLIIISGQGEKLETKLGLQGEMEK